MVDAMTTEMMGEGGASRRGRGRPKGSLGFKRVLKMADAGQAVDPGLLSKARALAGIKNCACVSCPVKSGDSTAEIETLATASPATCGCESNPQPTAASAE